MSQEAQWTVSDHLDERGEIIFERGGKLLIQRLHKLARKGYKPDFDMDTDSIWLHHTARKDRWPHDTLILYPSGLVVSLQTSDVFRCEPWETEKFEQFLKMVPMPTLADKTRDFRGYVLMCILLFAILVGFAFGVEWLASVVGSYVRSAR